MTRRHVALGLAIISVGAAFGIIGLTESSFFSVPPLPNNPRILKATQIENVLKSDLQIVRTVPEVPAKVKDGFSSVLHEPFQMANPGQKIGTDMLERGVPNERLVFAGYTNHIVVLVFDVGGFVTTRNVFVLDRQDDGGVFGATLKGYPVNDTSSLIDDIRAGQFTIW